MLIRLGRWLRMVGLDVANPEGSDDKELLERTKAEGRILLTRDMGAWTMRELPWSSIPKGARSAIAS
jgi:uncharacterized protein with PIN domain